MKKVIFALTVCAAVAAFGELKIGTVEMRTLVRNHASYETNKKLLQDAERDYQKKLDRMKADLESLQERGKKASEQMKNPMLAAKEKEKLEKELIGIQNEFVGGQQKLRAEAMESQQKLQEFESRLLKMTTDDIRKRVNEFAEKNGYDLIVEATVTAFSKKSLSVTDDILRAMGVDPKSAKGKDDENEGK